MQSVHITTNVVSSNTAQVLDTTLCGKVCQRLLTGRWFSPGTSVSSNNKTDRCDITEILLNVALNTIKLKTNTLSCIFIVLANPMIVGFTTTLCNDCLSPLKL
jgi:hypothetical protein